MADFVISGVEPSGSTTRLLFLRPFLISVDMLQYDFEDKCKVSCP
jgi:hypothetical protein